MTMIKRRLNGWLLAITIIISLYFIVSGISFFSMLNVLRAELPGKDIKVTMFMPWPFGPMLIGGTNADSDLYKSSIGNGGLIVTKSLRVQVHESDGSVLISNR